MKNEQDLLDDAAYFRVAKALVAGIRAESPGRLIIADGLNWGRIPVPALAELGIAQSTRGYDPMPVSHWQAEWVEGSDQWARPTWPLWNLRGSFGVLDSQRTDIEYEGFRGHQLDRAMLELLRNS